MLRMNKLWVAGILIALVAGVYADTSLTGFGAYWDGDDAGTGIGVRLRKTILAFAAVEGSCSYLDFSDSNTEMVPLDVSINARLPFMISPYVGVGVEYGLVNTDQAGMDDFSGYFAQLGVEATFLWLGVMAEIRYHETEEDYFDGPSANVGVLLKW